MIAMMAMIPRNPGVAEKEAIVWGEAILSYG